MENYAFEIVETARLIRREANKRAAVLGATKAQWRVLAWLKRTGDGARQIDLAEGLDVEPITLCRMIDRLEEAGLVERRRDEADRRAWRIHLTAAAAPVLAKLEEMGRTFNADMLRGISEAERAALLKLLARLRDNLDQNEQELETA
ncbi:MAG TPA: MarR family transcriptional regulator [Allosphingosinicella sp.]|nr:MarR family transcriptional regulator [Allosphingosinicella sp.]